MSMLEVPPELADGGYWYAVGVVPDPDRGGKTPGKIPNVGWCAWYDADVAVIRCTAPFTGMSFASPDLITNVLTANGFSEKPYSRVGGR